MVMMSLKTRRTRGLRDHRLGFVGLSMGVVSLMEGFGGVANTCSDGRESQCCSLLEITSGIGHHICCTCDVMCDNYEHQNYLVAIHFDGL
jgi:hypothetical protein